MRAPLLLAIALILPTATAGVPPGVAPDGPAGPVVGLAALVRGEPGWGANVTTPLVEVVNVSCPDCASATVAADFWVRDANGTTLRVHESHAWQSTYNVKKQLFVPAVGMRVVAQGRLENDSAGWFLNAKRWAEDAHPGRSATIAAIVQGTVPTGTYVWVAGARVANVARWNDGDYSFDLVEAAGGNLFVHSELGPPFWNQLRIPHANETVNPYGMVRFDPDHGWWEIHPIRCWSPAECVPLSTPYVRNGPTPGTPPTAGAYLEGAPLAKEANASRNEEDATRLTSDIATANATTLVVRIDGANITRLEISFDNTSWAPLAHAGSNWTFTRASHGNVFRLRASFPDGGGATLGTFPWMQHANETADAPAAADALESASPTPTNDHPGVATMTPITAKPTLSETKPARVPDASLPALVLLVGVAALRNRRRR